MSTALDITPLRRDETAMLRACEAEIEKGLDSFFTVGQALAVIRDSRLYRETHTTWEAYLEARWRISARRAQQYMRASQIADEIGTMVRVLPGSESQTSSPGVLPANERQTRPLASLSPEERREAWLESVETAPRGPDGKPRVTAEHVKRTVERRQRSTAAAAPDSEPLSSPPSLDEPVPATAGPQAAKAPETVLDAVTTVAAMLNAEDFDGARESATTALRVLDKRWPGTPVENLRRSADRLQKALIRDGQQKTLANFLAVMLRAIAEAEA